MWACLRYVPCGLVPWLSGLTMDLGFCFWVGCLGVWFAGFIWFVNVVLWLVFGLTLNDLWGLGVLCGSGLGCLLVCFVIVGCTVVYGFDYDELLWGGC